MPCTSGKNKVKLVEHFVAKGPQLKKDSERLLCVNRASLPTS